MSNEMLIRFCAPTLACLKTGNMFTCLYEDRNQMLKELEQLNRKMVRKGLRVLPLKWYEKRVLIYLYRPRLLKQDLSNPLARKLLAECGYGNRGVNACLARLINRMHQSGEFPHEVGLFLGYPPADVDGFMHRKESFKCCGVWKVYDDVDGALRKFELCRRCTEVYLNRYEQGYSLNRLIVNG